MQRILSPPEKKPPKNIIRSTCGTAIFIDPEDYDYLDRFKWKLRRSAHHFYAIRKKVVNGKEFSIRMHREIMQCPKGFEVHHINKNALDNRKSNLQIVSPQEHKDLHRKSLLKLSY